MAFETISLDVEACERLKSVRRPNESFSQAIKRVVRPPLDPDRVVRKLRRLSPAAVKAIARQVNRRTRASRRQQ